MMRIFLFLATNIAVLLVASVTLSLLGVDRYTGQNHGDLLIFCAVFGFTGSLISLLISKWMAKRSTGTQVIDQPRTRQEQWLLQTVEQLDVFLMADLLAADVHQRKMKFHARAIPLVHQAFGILSLWESDTTTVKVVAQCR